MAHKKAAGSAKNLRDSNAKYRGVKLFGGQTVRAGNIIIRQKGDKYQLGKNVYKGADFTIHAEIDGVVAFRKKNFTKYNGRVYLKTVVDVVPAKKETIGEKVKKGEKVAVVDVKEKTVVATKKAAPEKKPVAKKVVEKKSTEKKVAATKKPVAKKVVEKKPAEKTVVANKKPVAKKVVEKKPAVKKPVAPKKPVAKKPAAKKT